MSWTVEVFGDEGQHEAPAERECVCVCVRVCVCVASKHFMNTTTHLFKTMYQIIALLLYEGQFTPEDLILLPAVVL